MSSGLQSVRNSLPRSNRFSGGRVRLAIAGGAALNNSLGRFFCALELPLGQGYGLTETSPVVSVAVVGNNNPVTVGNPLPNVQVRN